MEETGFLHLITGSIENEVNVVTNAKQTVLDTFKSEVKIILQNYLALSIFKIAINKRNTDWKRDRGPTLAWHEFQKLNSNIPHTSLPPTKPPIKVMPR